MIQNLMEALRLVFLGQVGPIIHMLHSHHSTGMPQSQIVVQQRCPFLHSPEGKGKEGSKVFLISPKDRSSSSTGHLGLHPQIVGKVECQETRQGHFQDRVEQGRFACDLGPRNLCPPPHSLYT